MHLKGPHQGKLSSYMMKGLIGMSFLPCHVLLQTFLGVQSPMHSKDLVVVYKALCVFCGPIFVKTADFEED